MQKLRRFFDHLHAHEDLAPLRKPFVISIAISTVLFALVAPLSLTIASLMLLSAILVTYFLNFQLPVGFCYALAAIFLVALTAEVPGGITSPEFIASIFVILALCQGLSLRKYWHGELLIIWLLASNASTLLFDESATLAVWVLIVMIINLGQMLRLHVRYFSIETLINSLRSAARTALYALPMLAMFVYTFEKSYDKHVKFSDNSMTGISSSLEPGKISKLSKRSGTAYRVILDRQLPPIVELYWKVSTFTRSKGLRWKLAPQGPRPSKIRFAAASPNCEVRQKIFALDGDARSSSMALDTPIDGTFSSGSPAEVVSNVCTSSQSPLTPAERTANLKVEAAISPRVENLVKSFKQRAHTPEDTAMAIISYFKKNKFRYTLQPQLLNETAGLEDFLFVAREGFCEHYSAAVATLLRLAGVPARVVVGFQGGLYNNVGGYWLISFQDAHAWVEFWDDSKWQRFDPTALVAPQELGESRMAKSGIMRFLALPLFNWIWLGLDGFFFKIDRLFSGRDKLLSLGELTLDPALALVSLLLLFIVYRIRKALTPLEKVVHDEFRSFCFLFALYGLRRNRTEGYEHFRQRLFRWLQNQNRYSVIGPAIDQVFWNYQRFRYGQRRFERQEMKELIAHIKQLRKQLRSRFWARHIITQKAA